MRYRSGLLASNSTAPVGWNTTHATNEVVVQLGHKGQTLPLRPDVDYSIKLDPRLNMML